MHAKFREVYRLKRNATNVRGTLANLLLPKMPPKRKAAAGSKGPSLPTATADSPAARRQKKAEAEPAEETTTVEVPGSRRDWLAPLYDMYTKREMYDVAIIVGDRPKRRPPKRDRA